MAAVGQERSLKIWPVTRLSISGRMLSDEIESEVTEKPIDRVFHGCITPGQHVPPQPNKSPYWFNSLNYFFNGSVGKYESKSDKCPLTMKL